MTQHNLLIYEAKRWVGVVEKGGNNKGEFVSMFQKATDGVAQGEAWCMAFVQFCLKHTDGILTAISSPSHHGLYVSEHCQTVLEKSLSKKVIEPYPGCIVIWGHFKGSKNTGQGHTGVIVEVRADGKLVTIEGNTGSGDGVVRDGDGVFKRVRDRKGEGDMKVLGFVDPWKA